MRLKSLSGPALLIAGSFGLAMLASFGFIGVASRDLGDEQFGEVAFVWLTVGAAPAMLALGNHLLLQRTAARRGGRVNRSELAAALVWPALLLCGVALLVAGAWLLTGNRFLALTLLTVPALAVDIVRTVAGEAARVVAGPVRTILSSGQARVVAAVAVLFVVRGFGHDWTAPVVLGVMLVVSGTLAVVAIAQCDLVPSDPSDPDDVRVLVADRDRSRQMLALSAVSAVPVVFSRMPLWSFAIVPSDVVDQVAIGLTFFTLFSQPQAITNLALTAEIAEATHDGDRGRLRRALRGAITVNTFVAIILLAALVAFGDVALPVYAGDRGEDLLGVVLIYAIAGSIVSASGPGALILQFEGRDRSLVRLAVPSMVVAAVLFPVLTTFDSAALTGVGLVVVTLPYNVGATWLAFRSPSG